ncbi:MAG TPA: hypothetical protein VFD49_04820 [Candidatus Dormibacteraeota bacterium]|nr:hypothetical protein [Candidatus Dormibacteraeota bacterium]
MSAYSQQPAVVPDRNVMPSGWMLFAAIMILISGLFNAFDGLFGFFRATYYIGRPIGGSIWIWALVLLVFGVVQIAAGLAIMSGQSWGRWFGIVVISLNALLHLLVVALYPWWSLTIIAIDLLVIYGLTAGWRNIAPRESQGPVG